jgi:hypothetical protein
MMKNPAMMNANSKLAQPINKPSVPNESTVADHEI